MKVLRGIYDGKGYREIADNLNYSMVNVKSIIMKGVIAEFGVFSMKQVALIFFAAHEINQDKLIRPETTVNVVDGEELVV